MYILSKCDRKERNDLFVEKEIQNKKKTQQEWRLFYNSQSFK